MKNILHVQMCKYIRFKYLGLENPWRVARLAILYFYKVERLSNSIFRENKNECFLPRIWWFDVNLLSNMFETSENTFSIIFSLKLLHKSFSWFSVMKSSFHRVCCKKLTIDIWTKLRFVCLHFWKMRLRFLSNYLF